MGMIGVSNPSPVVLTAEQLLAGSTAREETDPIISEIFGECETRGPREETPKLISC